MRVGLIDVDGHNFPNLALMKISAYHKEQGDSVFWYDPLFAVDKVYISKVFSFTPAYTMALNCDVVERGGSGYGLKNTLPPEIENTYPDYSLYGIADTAYGFLTRGCPLRCPFCIVPKKEGAASKRVATLDNFWRGQKYIKLLDPNLLACKERIGLLNELRASGAYIDFTQGLDARLLDDETIRLLKEIKIKMIHFAWDSMNDSEIIIRNIKQFMKETGYSRKKVGVYILTNFNTTFEEDLERVYTLRGLGTSPYIMIYEKEKLPPKRESRLRKLQGYVNNKIIFNSVKRFEEYDWRKG